VLPNNHASKLLILRALPESIKFRVPDPELDRELGTYYGGNYFPK
jgi:hypothetical protein